MAGVLETAVAALVQLPAEQHSISSAASSALSAPAAAAAATAATLEFRNSSSNSSVGQPETAVAASSPESGSDNQVLFRIALSECEITFGLSKVDLLNVGCNSRSMFALLESKHYTMTIYNPFSTHSMLRCRPFTNIVHTLCSCLPDTIRVLANSRYAVNRHVHPLRSHLQLRITCRWMLQAVAPWISHVAHPRALLIIYIYLITYI